MAIVEAAEVGVVGTEERPLVHPITGERIVFRKRSRDTGGELFEMSLYLAGGMATRILPLLRTGPFLERLGSKGRDTEFLRELPVHIIANTEVGLIGAALTGLQGL